MIRIYLTAEEQNARFVKSFRGRSRGVLALCFDQIFFEPEGQTVYPVIPKDSEATPAQIVAMFGDETAELEYLACTSIRYLMSPGILGLITERRPEIGKWVLEMIQRQRKITAEMLAKLDFPDHPTPKMPDNYPPYEVAVRTALARMRAHDLLGELRNE